MTNEMPKPENYTGLSRLVLQYADNFARIIKQRKGGSLSESDWAPMEELVDIDNFQRVGILLTDKVEVATWQQYRAQLDQFCSIASWEGTLRRITEVPGLVFLELEERITIGNVMDVYNTVTIYQFNQANKLAKLDVYAALLGRRTLSA